MRRLDMAIGSEKYARGTRRQQLLAEMERVVPWVGLILFPQIGLTDPG